MMVKEGYKEVHIGPKKYKFPLDWDIKSFDEISEKITDGTHSTPDYVNDGIPFLSTQNIVPFRKFDFDNYEKYISEEAHTKLKERCNPQKGDILISKCGTIGRSKLIDTSLEFNIFVGLALLKLNNEIHGEYIEQYLNYEPMRKILELNSPGSTRKTLTIKSIKNIRLPIPNIKEQKKIASILSSVDKAIEKTDQVIEKTKELKKGLMQKLLTKGIGHSEFKNSILGKIPKIWEIKQLRDICTKVTDGTHDTPKVRKEGFPFITAKNITNGKLDFENCGYVSKEDHLKIINRSKPENGDILFTHIGTIGEVVKVNVDFEFSIKNVALFKPDNDKINSDYFNFSLQSNLVQNFIERILQGGVQQYLGLNTLRGFNIPVPPLKEQKKIASILSSVDNKIEKEKEYKEKLERLKKGLMQKLLTGEVRVNVKQEV